MKILGDEGLNLLESLLVYDPASRISAKQACMHGYFLDGANKMTGVRTNGFH